MMYALGSTVGLLSLIPLIGFALAENDTGVWVCLAVMLCGFAVRWAYSEDS